jgi:branched-chain amino acid aminotransferase
MNGFVAEGPGANMFFEKDGRLFTPSLGHILPGITRATVLEICASLGIEVIQKFFNIDEVYDADAAFFCGTAAEVIGWESLDGKTFKKNWNDTLSKKVQQAYAALIIEK